MRFNLKPSFQSDLEPADFARLRLVALNRILWAVVIIGGGATAFALYFEYSAGHFGTGVFYIFLYLLAVIAGVRKQLGYSVRASIFISIVFILAISELMLYGLDSLMDMEFLAAIILTGLFFNFRAAVYMLCGSITTILLAVIIHEHGGIKDYLPIYPDNMPWSYVISTILNLSLMAAPALIMLNTILTLLHKSLADTQELVNSLRHENEERAYTEKIARDNESRFRAIYDGVKDAILLHDINSRKIFDANIAARKMYGYSLDAMREGTLAELNNCDPPFTGNEFEKRLNQALNGGEPVFAWRIRPKTGNMVWVEVSVHRTNVSDIESALVTVRDIEIKKQHEAELLQEKRFSEALVNSIPELFLLYNDRLKLLQWNNNLEAVTGLKSEVLLGQSIWDWDFKSDEVRIKLILSDTRAADRFTTEAELTLKSGEKIPYLFTGTRFVRSGKKYLLAIATDLSRLKQAEAEMKMLSTAIDQSAESVVVTNNKGLIEYVNPAFEDTTGYSREEIIGQNPSILRYSPEAKEPYESLWNALRNGKGWNGRLLNKKKDGTIFTEEISISPVRDSNGHIIQHVAVGRDVSNIIEMESQLRQAQKMEAVGQLAGGVAHDFNNLLQVISGYSEILLNRDSLNEEIRTDLEEISSAADRASALVRQLLAFSRRESLSLTLVDINELTNELLKMVRRVIGENVTLTFAPGNPLPQLRADAGQIEQVILNLCVNARDAMPNGGTIHIETNHEVFDKNSTLVHPDAKEGDYVVIQVSDTGCGISEELQGRIFEPFFTTKGVGEGTGLGLSTVYAVATRHEGFITLTSKKDEGAVFKVYLRATSIIHSHIARSKNVLEVLHGKGECILVAEDDAHVRQLVTTLLERANYRVIVAPDGAVAIQLFESHRDEIDIALLDVVMPVKNGRAVYEHIKKQDPNRPIVFTSGYTQDLLRAEQLPDEDFTIVKKPYDLPSLLKTLREALDERNSNN